MKTGLLAAALLAVTLGQGGANAAEPSHGGVEDFLLRPLDPPRPMASRMSAQPAVPQAKVTTQDNGLPVLWIRGWNKAHDRPSIQVALVLDKAIDPATLAPLAINGPAALTAWKHEIEMLDQPIPGVPGQIRSKSLALLELAERKLLRLRGHDNGLNKPAVYGMDESGLRLVFYVLESWSDLHGDFRAEARDLDLTTDKYAQPGQLRIWLLDDEKPVWSDTIAWPGKQEKAVSPKPVESTKPKGDAAPRPPISPSGSGLTPAPTGPAAPATKQPTSSSPSLGPANPVLPPSNSPSPQAVQPQPPPDIKEMSVDQLVDHIENTWRAQMPSRVRRAWQGGIFYYYKTQNPAADRLSIFMNVVRDCYWQTSGELQDTFLVLYVKLKQRQPPSGPH